MEADVKGAGTETPNNGASSGSFSGMLNVTAPHTDLGHWKVLCVRTDHVLISHCNKWAGATVTFQHQTCGENDVTQHAIPQFMECLVPVMAPGDYPTYCRAQPALHNSTNSTVAPALHCGVLGEIWICDGCARGFLKRSLVNLFGFPIGYMICSKNPP